MPHPVARLPVPSTYAKILLQQPLYSSDLLSHSGLTAESLGASERITVAQQLQVFRNALLLAKTPEWGLKLGQRLNVNSHGPLGFAALCAPTIGDGLDVFVDFARTRAPYFHLLAERSTDYYRLIVKPAMPLTDLELPLSEILLLVAEAYVIAVLGHAPGQSGLQLAYPRPAHADLYREYFTLPYRFDAPVTCLQLPLQLCAMPCPLHDQETFQAALARCRDALAAVIDPNDAASKVKNLLASQFDRVGLGEDFVPQPGLALVASRLSVSPRTLIRQLDLQGTSYRQLLEQQQVSTAKKLLDQARYSVADIGNLLGYSDAANFGRAFRRWTGISPGNYRRRSR
ncbi:MAG: AraC family transcriptional regulator [Halieaceae bacterium]|jgi:AraC-like DNA-binding protein|nr:AraC family transcriptional regulator [Halieaceae bacterium]